MFDLEHKLEVGDKNRSDINSHTTFNIQFNALHLTTTNEIKNSLKYYTTRSNRVIVFNFQDLFIVCQGKFREFMREAVPCQEVNEF